MVVRLLVEAGATPASDRCTLSSWSGDPTRCRWCDAAARLDGRWCSFACQDAHDAQHDWGQARLAALTRDDDACVECGTGPATVAASRLLLRALIPMGPVAAARLWHSEGWLAFELAGSVDVVHRHPPREGYRSGCHHHLDGLVTLCRGCEQKARTSIDLRAG